MYQIVVSDLDGTLLSPNNTIAPWVKETLQILTAQKINFVFATGRHYMDVDQIRKSLKIKAYMITANGARVHDTHGKLIVTNNIDQDIAAYLFEIVYNDPDIITNVYRDNEWFTNRYCADETNLFNKVTFDCLLQQKCAINPEGISKVFFTSNKHELLLLLEQMINYRWGNRVNVSFSTLTCLEVMAGNVSKGSALAMVVKLLGYELKDCIAFGDGMNDAEMLSMVGKGCIMGNAHQRLKDLYPKLEVIGTNADNAVPKYLRKLYL